MNRWTVKRIILRMKPVFFMLISVVMTQCGIAQLSQPAGLCENSKFDKEVAKWITQSVPVVGSVALYNDMRVGNGPDYILDARDEKEYEVSHLPGAIRVGYDDFKKGNVRDIPKNAKLVIYCSIGYRSEKIAIKLRKMGYSNVTNLYGSIFDWANRDFPLEDAKGDTVHRVHTYNKNWGKWVDDRHVEKIW